MRMIKNDIPAAAFAVAALFWPALTGAEPVLTPGVSDTEIRIGSVMPYTGSLAAFGAIGRAEAAYFDMVNDNGGINGRKVRFISYDDSADPTTATEQTRKLIETDQVLLMFGQRTAGQSQDFPLDHGMAADLSRRGAHLRELHPGLLSRAKDRRALAKRSVRKGSVRWAAGRARRLGQDDRRRYYI